MDDILLEHPAPHVARIVLNDPAERNRMGPERRKLLHRLFDQVLDDPDVRAIVLTGAGGVFCAGGNVKGFGTREPTQQLANIRGAQALARRMAQAEKPVVAAVEGFAAGAGVSYACLADVIVGDESSKFVMSFVRVGMTPDLGLHYTLGQRVGPARARRMLMLGQRFEGQAALDVGLLDELTPPGQVQSRALEIAQGLAEGPASALASLKRGIYVAGMGLDAVLEYEAAAMTAAMSGKEAAEGAAAFREKRPPKFL